MRRLGTIVLGIFALLSIFGEFELQAADQYPAKPIVAILPTEAGSTLDILSRPLLQKASTILGQPVMLVNKPGAGGVIGTQEIFNSKPDGYTIGTAGIALITTRLQGLLPFDYQELAYLGTFYKMYMIVFGSNKTNHPFKTIQELVSYAKAHPGDVMLAASAVGQSTWVGAMAFLRATGISVNAINVPGGGGLAIVQLAGGHMDFAVDHLPAAVSQIEGGNVRVLAVMGDERAPGYKNIPTLKEIGYDVSFESTGFIVGPPKMPKDAVNKLTNAFKIAATDPEYHKFLSDRFAAPFHNSPDKIGPYMEGQRKVVWDIMEKAGILKVK